MSKKIIRVNSHSAITSYDAEIDMLCGEFMGLNAHIPSEPHEKLVLGATAQGKNLNAFVRQVIEYEVTYI
ncbi:toxin-antitoxin system HicB family antitoxin [Acinetobacter sp. NIPH 2699]|uniref:toxin-antitoxin system HicB family antitoxin n=1 Tax=Acinetobacter sp. NIPH 2699 TaxID=2923433 RepID=UPI001F4B708F|nr:toxin-antitoxin system HicB family antitoxin [Acinetobacter sp. NIPH 2699]MCH7335315.1 toxin-antitoxin system HicB family antitoxin [Acinetobacter sp. NIPH 2699]